MKLRLEAGPGELESKSLSAVRHVASALAKYDARLFIVAKALWKADLAAVGEVDYQGLTVEIENPIGSVRHWHNKQTGHGGSTVMQHPYGRIRGTRGADGDGYDCFLGPDPDAPFVWIVHQAQPDGVAYDEDKAMLGFSDAHEAAGAYHAHYDNASFFGSMSQMPIEEFRAKVMRTAGPGQDGMVKHAARSLRSPFRARSRTPAEQQALTAPEARFVVPADAKSQSELSKSGLAAYLTDGTPAGLANRAVHGGVSGPNIAMGVPPASSARTDVSTDPMSASSMRAPLEASVADRDADRKAAPRRDPAVYNVASLTELPLHPVSEWEQRAIAGEEARKDAPDNLRYVQDKLDRRSWFVREGHPERLLPRDPRAKEKFFIPAPTAETAKQERALKSVPGALTERAQDDILPDDKPAPRPPPEVPAKPEYKIERSITMEKAELGIVSMHVLKSDWQGSARSEPRYEIAIPGRKARLFTSLSAACDHVWVVQKGYRDVEHWRRETGRRKVPSGAGWRFWGVQPANETELEVQA